VNESVVDTVVRFGRKHCGVLNFASAKNPGGGFLKGSLAQEEALAVSSDLYNSQLQVRELYDINRNCRTALYTHNMIYSKGITFIRDGKLKFVSSPARANVLTAPAVNAGAYYKNERGNKTTVLAIMEQRIRYILNIFASKGDHTIILGAYGCGVFGNDVVDIANIFRKLLVDAGMEKHFKHIIFAVYDSSGQQFNVFQRLFGNGKTQAWFELKSELDKGRHSGEKSGWIPADELWTRLEPVAMGALTPEELNAELEKGYASLLPDVSAPSMKLLPIWK
jgi:uncharacterized protein (TIGR02452 family)